MFPILCVLLVVFLWMDPCTTVCVLLLALLGYTILKK